MEESGGTWHCQSGLVQFGGQCGSVRMIRNIFLSGLVFNKLSVFGEFMAEITFVEVAEDSKSRFVLSTHSIWFVSLCGASYKLACGRM